MPDEAGWPVGAANETNRVLYSDDGTRLALLGHPGASKTIEQAPPALSIHLAHFSVPQATPVSWVRFVLAIAASLNDSCDLGIYQTQGDATTGTLSLVVNTGTQAGLLNAGAGGGVKQVNLTKTVTLVPGIKYWGAFMYGAIAGTAAQLAMLGHSSVNTYAASELLCKTIGGEPFGADQTFAAFDTIAALPLPASLSWTQAGAVPQSWYGPLLAFGTG